MFVIQLTVSLAFLAINCFAVPWTARRIFGSIRCRNAFFTSTKQIDLIVSGKNVTYQINFLLTRYCFIYYQNKILVYVLFFYEKPLTKRLMSLHLLNSHLIISMIRTPYKSFFSLFSSRSFQPIFAEVFFFAHWIYIFSVEKS